ISGSRACANPHMPGPGPGAAATARLGTWCGVPLLAFLPSPSSNGFHVGPLLFRAYGICYVFAVLAAVVVTGRRWAKHGGDPALAQECALYGFPAGLIGGGGALLLSGRERGAPPGGGAVGAS